MAEHRYVRVQSEVLASCCEVWLVLRYKSRYCRFRKQKSMPWGLPRHNAQINYIGCFAVLLDLTVTGLIYVQI